MENENLDREKLASKKNTIKIILGVLRAAVIINVIYYLVKLWAGQAVGPIVLLPAAVCIVFGIIVYMYKRKLA
jgi:membrane protein YdbS with pleckstrin-like domain